ncbi:MAG TPA: VOC family protein [Verrucomicrobiae bacterium]|nr:VOC family protein [Verrucomicrobiae bacterium]
MQKITACLWFDDNAEEAAEFYTAIFPNSKVTGISRYGEAGAKVAGRPKGSVLVITFRLDGQEFMALNGGPQFKFNEAVSFVVNCKTQAELDRYWKKLSAGGEEVQCGWLTDKFGVSWQIVSTVVAKMMQDKDGEKSNRVMQAVLRMKKLDIKKLKTAYSGK